MLNLYNYYTDSEILHYVNKTLNNSFIIPIWTSYVNIINIILVSLFLLIIGLILPQKPKYIKYLNFIAALYIIITVYISSLNIIGLNNAINATFSNFSDLNFNWYPHVTPYTNLFLIVSSFAVIFILLGISDKLFIAENNKMEFLLLVMFIYLSAVLLLNSSDFISSLILLECIAFSSYILVGFERKNKFSTSSGIKYLILGSIPGGLFVLGLILLYKNYGSFFFFNLESLLCVNEDIYKISENLYNINMLNNDNNVFYDLYNLKGIIKTDMGEYSEALTALEKLRSVVSNSPEVVY